MRFAKRISPIALFAISNCCALLAADARTGLVGWWMFDETSGSIAEDSSGNNNFGTLNGNAAWTSGKFGGALDLNGTTAYLQGSSPGNGFPIGSAARTISAWMKLAHVPTGEDTIFAYGNGATASPANFYVLVTAYTGAPNIPVGRFAFGNIGGAIVGSTSVADGNWHHVVGVYEGPGTNIGRIYVDGVQQAAGTIPTPATGSGANWRIGSSLGGGPGFFGTLDDIRIYARALSADDVQALYTGGETTVANVLSAPQGLAFDAADNLYIADAGANRVWMWSKDGMLRALAGTGVAGSTGDNGPATASTLNNPTAVAVDHSNNIYVADTGNHRIRMVTPGGVIATAVGTGVAGTAGGAPLATQLNRPQGVAVDSSNRLFIGDTGNGIVRMISSGVVAAAVSNPSLVAPAGLALKADGTLYIADLGGDAWKVVPAPVSSLPPFVTDKIPGSYLLGGFLPLFGAISPQALALDANGNVFVTDTGYHRIKEFDKSGHITIFAGTGTAGFAGDGGPANEAQLNNPMGIAVDSTGNVWVADTGNGRIRRIAKDGTISTVIGGNIVQPPPAITIETDPAGLQFSVDGGAAQTAPGTIAISPGTHTIAVAPVQSNANCNGYNYSETVTIHHEYVAADAGNYTVTIAGTWPELATVANSGYVANANGYDICFADAANAGRLSWELESYDGTTGTLVAHVLAGAISASADTTFSVYFGNPSISNFQGGATGSAWDSSTYPYAAIWHLGSGATLDGSDSSGKGNSLVNHGATATAGPIGGGAAFASTYMSAAASGSLDFGGPVSFSFWTNPTSFGNTRPVLASRTACNAGNWQIYDNVNGGLYFNFWDGSTNVQALTRTLPAAGVWSHVAITYDGSLASFYLNGTLTNSVSMNGTRNNNANTLVVGWDSCGGYMAGALDEIRMAQGAWPAGLIQTMFNNQSAPGTFVTLSGMTALDAPSAAAGTQYVFTGWSDGGAASHYLTVDGSAAAYYKATFKTQYQLTTAASPAGSGTVNPESGAFYDAGTVVPITATAGDGYVFDSWTGAVADPGSAATGISMPGAQSVTANFVPAPDGSSTGARGRPR